MLTQIIILKYRDLLPKHMALPPISVEKILSSPFFVENSGFCIFCLLNCSSSKNRAQFKQPFKCGVDSVGEEGAGGQFHLSQVLQLLEISVLLTRAGQSRAKGRV